MENNYSRKIAPFIKIWRLVEQSGNMEASNLLGKIIAAKQAPTAGRSYGRRSMRIRNGRRLPVNHNYDVVMNTVESCNYQVPCPLKAGWKRFILHWDPSRLDISKKISDGLFMEGKCDFATMIENAKKILEACGKSRDDLVVYDEFGDPINIDRSR